MTDPSGQPLERRFLLRGGAVLAGAAGATVLGAALIPKTAEAAPVEYVRLNSSASRPSPRGNAVPGSASNKPL